MEGFKADGEMDENEQKFDPTLCQWDLLQSATSGSLLRAWNPTFSHYSGDLGDLLENWYYDDANPVGLGSHDAPVFANGWTMCSARMNGENIAWGTSGIKTKDVVPGIPNTDPLRVGNFEDLPPEACQVPDQDELAYLSVTSVSYYLDSAFDVNQAQEQSQKALHPLYRKVRC